MTGSRGSTRAGVRLPRSFYVLGADELAPRLLGQRVVRVLGDGRRLAGIVVEAEAYLGVRDAACHTYKGRRTERNEAMYGMAGTAYVYFTYGMHYCMNVVCGVNGTRDGGGTGEAVLIRALEPVEGIEWMREHRGAIAKRERDLCSGPAKLCRAMLVDRALNASDLVLGTDLVIERGDRVPPRRVGRSTRIGIGGANPWAGRRLRFLVTGNPHVSVKA